MPAKHRSPEPAPPGDAAPRIGRLAGGIAGRASTGLPTVALAKQATYLREVGGRIVACAGLSHVCDGVDGSGAPTVVFELAGTRLTPDVGGLVPFRIQDV